AEVPDDPRGPPERPVRQVLRNRPGRARRASRARVQPRQGQRAAPDAVGEGQGRNHSTAPRREHAGHRGEGRHGVRPRRHDGGTRACVDRLTAPGRALLRRPRRRVRGPWRRNRRPRGPRHGARPRFGRMAPGRRRANGVRRSGARSEGVRGGRRGTSKGQPATVRVRGPGGRHTSTAFVPSQIFRVPFSAAGMSRSRLDFVGMTKYSSVFPASENRTRGNPDGIRPTLRAETMSQSYETGRGAMAELGAKQPHELLLMLGGVLALLLTLATYGIQWLTTGIPQSQYATVTTAVILNVV